MGEMRSALTAGPTQRRIPRSLSRSLWLALLLAVQGGAQTGQVFNPQQNGTPFKQPSSPSATEFDKADRIEQDDRLRYLNLQRQKSIVSDAGKLLKLASELNDVIGATNPDTLTPAQIKKITEIEKLAHNVKAKMSTPVTGASVLQP
jgi:hypothetical protein